MNREHVMSVLYDIALVIGGETSVRPLLTKTVQRILYHTSFPTGLVFLDPPTATGTATIEVRLDAAVGDFGFNRLVGKPLNIPTALLEGPASVIEDPELLRSLTDATRPYGACLRLPIDHEGVILLLAPRLPTTQLPLTHVFQPVMTNLAKALLLCRHNDAFAASLVAERDMAEQSLEETEEKFRSITSVAQDAILMIDDKGMLAYWNPAAERIFGYTAAEAIGNDAHRLIVPERYLQAFEKGFAGFRQTGNGPIIGKTLEIEALRKGGDEFPVELSVSALQLDGRWHAVGILRDITTRKRNEAALRQSEASLRKALLGTIQAVALMVEKRDPHTAGHQLRTARLAVAIAHELGWPADRIEGVRLSAIIHDIGKIYVPTEILSRPGKLNELEIELIRSHSQVGFDIIRNVAFPWPVAQIILQHHERFDGTGYPNHLAGEQIIPEARVLAVADVVEAMTSHRPFRPASSIEEALEEIARDRGTHFDPEVVDACLRVFREHGFSFEELPAGAG